MQEICCGVNIETIFGNCNFQEFRRQIFFAWKREKTTSEIRRIKHLKMGKLSQEEKPLTLQKVFQIVKGIFLVYNKKFINIVSGKPSGLNEFFQKWTESVQVIDVFRFCLCIEIIPYSDTGEISVWQFFC